VNNGTRYKPYPRYKHSGVDWLGDIPETWSIIRLRYAARVNPAKSEVENLDVADDVSFVPMESIGEDGTLTLDQSKPLESVYQGYTYFRDGDIMIAKITPCFENGKGALAKDLVNGVGFGTTELHVLRARDVVDRKFLFYLTRSVAFREPGEASMYGAGGQKRVPDEFVLNFKAAFPSAPEQRAIAEFLDRETSKIERLIARKERLIELLEEKRAALITQAVNRGLNPDAPLRDSGIEWLGQMPAHWEVWKLAHIAPIVTCGVAATPEYVAEGIPFLSAQNIKTHKVIFETSNLSHLKRTKR
jgi:type I restriction enzyme S subunit